MVHVRTATGEIEVSEQQLVTFVTPLLGFERLATFCIHQHQEGPLHWMQSVEDARVAFCLLAPFAAGLDPDIAIELDDVADIGADSVADIAVYSVVVLDKDPTQVRTNLRAPILVCRSTRKAKQVVLSNSKLPIRYFLNQLPPAGA